MRISTLCGFSLFLALATSASAQEATTLSYSLTPALTVHSGVVGLKPSRESEAYVAPRLNAYLGIGYGLYTSKIEPGAGLSLSLGLALGTGNYGLKFNPDGLASNSGLNPRAMVGLSYKF